MVDVRVVIVKEVIVNVVIFRKVIGSTYIRGTAQVRQRHNEGAEIEMVWTYAKKRYWV